MLYDKEKILNEAKTLIVDKKLIHTQDVIDLLPCCSTTFYEYFPATSEEMEEIRNLIAANKTQIKVGLRKKLYDGDSAAGHIALYKLVASVEERKVLADKFEDDSEAVKVVFEFGKLENKTIE